jgi:hypothetical protein
MLLLQHYKKLQVETSPNRESKHCMGLESFITYQIYQINVGLILCILNYYKQTNAFTVFLQQDIIIIKTISDINRTSHDSTK